MARTIKMRVSGFTPVIDGLVLKYGVTTALVFGRVWRYCQMETGVCNASQDTIAKALGISRQTVNMHLLLLCHEGYLEDITPPPPNGKKQSYPSVYRDSGKAGLKSNMSAYFEGEQGGVDNVDTSQESAGGYK